MAKKLLLACFATTLCLIGFSLFWTNNSIFYGVLKKILFGIDRHHVFRKIYLKHINVLRAPSTLTLTPGSTTFEFWKESVIPKFDVYFYNWTNPEDIQDPTKKPNLIQVGPYSFKLKVEKVNVTFHDNNTVSYATKKTWFFDQANSNGSLQDKVIQLNTVAVSAGFKVRFMDAFVQEAASESLDESFSNISIIKTVGELLFQGFDDPFMTLTQGLGLDENPPPFDKFGWMYKRNGSAGFDGHMNIGTGGNDLSDLGMIKQLNYKGKTEFYGSPKNILEGGAGDYLFPPFLREDSIKFFSGDLCQTISNEFIAKVDHMGIEGFKFSMDQKTLGNDTQPCYTQAPIKKTFIKVVPYDEIDKNNGADSEKDKILNQTDINKEDISLRNETADKDGHSETNATASNKDLYIVDQKAVDQVIISPDNNPCHCNGECAPVGLINVSACQYGLPLFMSLPHFYRGDPQLTDAVDGLEPREKDHDFYFVVNPTTGIPLDVAMRLQVNVMLSASEVVRVLKDVPKKLFFPMFWFEARAGIPDDKVFALKVLISLPEIIEATGFIISCIGFFLLFLFAFKLSMGHQLEKQKDFESDEGNSSRKKYVFKKLDVENNTKNTCAENV